MPALTVWTAVDGLMAAIAPLGLATAAGTCLVVDLDPDGPAYPGESSLAELVAEQPRRGDLTPRRRGVAVLRNGGVGSEEAAPVVAALLGGWPHLVLRSPEPNGEFAPLVPVYPLVPGMVRPPSGTACVVQRTGFPIECEPDGIVLPRPGRSTVQSLLGGRHPGISRWIRAWGPVWEAAWA